MWYELWDVASGNLISDFDSEAGAVEAARAYLTADASGPAVDVSIAIYGDDDHPLQALESDALAAWVSPERHARQLA
jgi:hypothetical protein